MKEQHNAKISPTMVSAKDSIDAGFDIHIDLVGNQVPDIPITTKNNQDI